MRHNGVIFSKINSVQRYVVWHHGQSIFRNIRVGEFPKSGGTWLCQMLGELFNLQNPRDRLLPLTQSIQHAHFTGPTRHKTILLLRDGRDVHTSAYFHYLIHADHKPQGLVNKWRAILGDHDFENVIETMPYFIEKFSTCFKIGGRKVNWSDHIQSYLPFNSNLLVVKYEDLISDAEYELNRILKWYDYRSNASVEKIIDNYNFEKQSKRKPGIESREHFLRKGIVGDWKNYFNSDSRFVFDKYHKDTLITVGYD